MAGPRGMTEMMQLSSKAAIRRGLIAAVAAAAVSWIAADASAAARVWVSGHGVDQAGCGAPTAPCRSLQYAHDNAVSAGGEIDILDPAGYGSLNITKAVSVVNDGVGTAGVQATSGNAININAGPTDAVYLRGLNIDGVQFGATNGVVLNSGGALTIEGCVIRHFANDGVLLNPASGVARVSIANTLASNETTGIADVPTGGTGTVSLVMDRVTVESVFNGVDITLSAANQGAAAVITNLITRNVGTIGLHVVSAPGTANAIVSLDSSSIANSATGDVFAGNAATLYLSRSVISQAAGIGLDNETSAPGAVFSYGDNRVVDNVTNLAGAALVTQPLH